MKFKELRAGRLEGASPRGSELRTSDQCLGVHQTGNGLVAGYLGILVYSIGRFTVLAAGWYTRRWLVYSSLVGILVAGFAYISVFPTNGPRF